MLISWIDVKTAVKLSSLVQGTGQGLLFANCGVGIDASAATVGLFNLIDSRATNTTTLLNASAMSSGSVQGSLVVENVYVDSSVGAVRSSTAEGSQPYASEAFSGSN